jgi:uncharacterized membrane protein
MKRFFNILAILMVLSFIMSAALPQSSPTQAAAL